MFSPKQIWRSSSSFTSDSFWVFKVEKNKILDVSITQPYRIWCMAAWIRNSIGATRRLLINALTRVCIYICSRDIVMLFLYPHSTCSARHTLKAGQRNNIYNPEEKHRFATHLSTLLARDSRTNENDSRKQ